MFGSHFQALTCVAFPPPTLLQQRVGPDLCPQGDGRGERDGLKVLRLFFSNACTLERQRIRGNTQNVFGRNREGQWKDFSGVWE